VGTVIGASQAVLANFAASLPVGTGRLFGFTSQTEERRDLIILITPHIVDDLAAPVGRSN